MFPKIILSTGCSYGVFYESFRRKIEKDRNTFPGLKMLIDLHCVSLGSTFQMLSIIESVDKLLDNGVNPSDIYVLGEFSQMSRRDIIIGNEFFVDEIDNTEIKNENGIIYHKCPYPTITLTEHTDDMVSLSNKLYINKFFAGDFPKFGNYYMTNPESISLAAFPNKYLQPVFKKYSTNTLFSIEGVSIDTYAVETLSRGLAFFQNVMFVQEYLKLKNVKYKFCLMQNQFSLYSKSAARQDELKTLEKNGEHYLNQDYANSNQIWDISNPIKIIKNLINWDNWWFYENKNKNIIFGGIDEYAIDKFGVKAFPLTNGSGNMFGQHPDIFVYDQLIKEELMKEYFYD